MKPKEFDELVRQKFDQNDFAYNPANWDSLAEKLEGRAKKRSVIMWWWAPLAGMAASVALATGSTSLLRHTLQPPASAKTGIALTHKSSQPAPIAIYEATTAPSSHKEVEYADANNARNTKANSKNDLNISDWFHIRLNESAFKSAKEHGSGFNFLSGDNKVKHENKKEALVVKDVYKTFIPEEEEIQKIPKVSINLLGGYNTGSVNTGYTLGGTIRRMLNDHLYIESDVAFASSNNMQATQYTAVPAFAGANARNAGARTSNVEASKASLAADPAENIESSNVNYNLYYAQVSPGFGYKIISRLSVGLGPDFQRMLTDNRPVINTELDKNNIQVAPLFDVGFIGKTEYALTKRVKTAVSYRKGVNNLITPTEDKYIDRNYLQFQLRYTIFNK